MFQRFHTSHFVATLTVALFFFVSGTTSAATQEYVSVDQYTNWYSGNSSTYRKNVKKLDDDVVSTLPVPVLFSVSLEDITPNFGDPRGGGTRSHEGLDMLAPKGVPIVSPTTAVVLKTGSGASAGKYVYTTNPGGETFVYMHLDTIANIKAGQLLKTGDLIGTVGDTGNANGVSHLHFEVRKKKALDPYPRIQKEFTLKEKISFLEGVLDDAKKTDDVTELLATQFSGILLLAKAQKLEIPRDLETALKKKGSLVSLEHIPTGLGLGDQGPSVTALQTALIVANLGADAHHLGNTGATGYFGRVTEAALTEFQKAFGVSVTGQFDVATKNILLAKPLAKIEEKPALDNNTASSTASILIALKEITKAIPTVATSDLANGAEGAEVSLVQTYLIVHAPLDVPELARAGATGYFGTVTESALRAYQTGKGIPSTGMYDAATRKAMLL